MLEHTFIHIPGIGEKTEQILWKRGIRTWHDFLTHQEVVFSPARDEMVRQDLKTSIGHCEDIKFFQSRLPSRDMWRLFEAFKDKSVYLDIETSGGFQEVDEITVIGLYDGKTVKSFVNGINLDEFEVAIAEYDLVITFSGTSFDLPFIRRWFKNIYLPPAHIDLRFLLKKLGYKGGLKKIEKDLGITREHEIAAMDGYAAVLLWKAYQWGDKSALERLIQYNTADIVNLRPIMEIGYHEMKRKSLFLSVQATS
ncbi:MAG: ribonuclease H-like domain-containing protein [Thermodesulfobacteriota bacterium]|nr:ribonuclease H-like domain-containing protein [Thermodesulfobacteriota bacterium]